MELFFQGHVPWKNSLRVASVDEGGAERSEIPLLLKEAAKPLLSKVSAPQRPCEPCYNLHINSRWVACIALYCFQLPTAGMAAGRPANQTMNQRP